MRCIVWDCETTGLLLPSSAPLEKQPRIIELGIVVVEDAQKVAEYNWLINPDCEITAEITKITGITNEDLADKPKFRELLGEIEEAFGVSDFGFCHNAPFDVGMMKNELARCARTGFPFPKEMICTAQEYTHVMGKRPRLIHLYEHIMGVPLAQTHRALDDAIAVYEVLEKDGFFFKLEKM